MGRFALQFGVFVLIAASAADAGFVYDQCRTVYDGGIKCLNLVSGGCEAGEKLHVCLRRIKRCMTAYYLPEPSRTGEVMPAELGGYPALLRVGRYRGMGVWGVVYDVQLEQFDSGLLRAIPELFSYARPRRDLAAKFVRRVTLRRQAEWQSTVRQERSQFEQLNQAFIDTGISPIPTSDILDYEEAPEPFLLKSQINDVDDFGGALEENGDLSPGKLALLRTQVYEPASRLFLATGLIVDAGVTNLFWDPVKRRWGLFELSFGREPFNHFYPNPDGFQEYVLRSKHQWRDRSWIDTPIEISLDQES